MLPIWLLSVETIKGIVANVHWQADNTLVLKVKLEKKMDFEIGQFIQLTYKDVTRNYSCCNFGEGNMLEMLIRVKPGGKMSGLLADMKAGEEVAVEGLFKEADFSKDKLLCIAGGSGQAAFMSLIRAVEEGAVDKDVVLFISSRKLEKVGFLEELRMLKKSKAVITLTRENREGCEEGRITLDMIKKHVDPEGYAIFICGPEEFTKSLGETLKEYKPHMMSW